MNLSDSLQSTNFDDLLLDNPTVIKFFLQLQHLIETAPANSNAFFQVLLILEDLCEHERIRKHLQDLRFVPLLGNVLHFEEAKENISMVLKILDKLTKNLIIDWPEFYLTTLIPFLVDSIEPQDSDNASTSCLCLSILVNLSESRPGIDILLKFCSSKELITKIKSYGFLSLKLHYLIDFFYKNTENVNQIVFAVFDEIDKAIIQNDATMCEECFKFVKEIARNALETCTETFESKLWLLLDCLKRALTDETVREVILIAGLHLFKVLIQSYDSLASFHKNLLSFALQCFQRDALLQVDALLLINALGERNIYVAEDEEDHLKSIWSKLFEWLKKDVAPNKSLAALQTLNTFVHNPKHQELILKTVSRYSLQAILEFDVEENVEKVKDERILLILAALNLMATFEAVEPQGWYGCVENELKTAEMRSVITQGFSRKNQDIFKCCLDLIRHSNFPSKEISCALYRNKESAEGQSSSIVAQYEKIVSPQRVLQKQSSQIDDLLKQFSENPGDMSESSAAVFVEYQDIYTCAKNDFYKQQIEEGKKHIAALTKLVNTLEAERRYTRSLICQYKISNEKAHNEVNKCTAVIEEREKSLAQVTSKNKDLTRRNREIEQEYEKKCVENKHSQEEMNNYVTESKGKIKELKELLKGLEEEKIKEQKKNELSQKVIDDMKKEANKRIARIQHLEEKVKEAESIKQKIHNLMNGL
uniref:Uncharacterized protein n=1 Tax=Lutzomyia longipalpis TaxID=7200 RepID=A0A1B0CWI4_LUTLO